MSNRVTRATLASRVSMVAATVAVGCAVALVSMIPSKLMFVALWFLVLAVPAFALGAAGLVITAIALWRARIDHRVDGLLGVGMVLVALALLSIASLEALVPRAGENVALALAGAGAAATAVVAYLVSDYADPIR